MNGSINVEWNEGIRGYMVQFRTTCNTFDEAKFLSEKLRLSIDKGGRLKELLTIKRDAQAILDDDTVNSWMTDKDATRRYTEAQVKQAAKDYNNAVKEIDLIIENL